MIADVDEARTIIRDCVCSDCWGELTTTASSYNPETRTTELTCTTEGCQFHGYISRKTVDRRELAAIAELHEAKAALAKAAPWIQKKSGLSEDELIKSLGF